MLNIVNIKIISQKDSSSKWPVIMSHVWHKFCPLVFVPYACFIFFFWPEAIEGDYRALPHYFIFVFFSGGGGLLFVFYFVSLILVVSQKDSHIAVWRVSWNVSFSPLRSHALYNADVRVGDTVVSNSGTPSSGTSGSSPLSTAVTTSSSSPVSGPATSDAAVMPSSAVHLSQNSTPKRQTLKELLASIPGFSLRVSWRRFYGNQVH